MPAGVWMPAPPRRECCARLQELDAKGPSRQFLAGRDLGSERPLPADRASTSLAFTRPRVSLVP